MRVIARACLAPQGLAYEVHLSLRILGRERVRVKAVRGGSPSTGVSPMPAKSLEKDAPPLAAPHRWAAKGLVKSEEKIGSNKGALNF